MRLHVAILLTTVLCLATPAVATAQTEAASDGGAAEAASEAGPSGPATGRLRFVHAAEGAPRLGIDLVSPTEGLIGMWVAEPETTVDLVPETPLMPGTYRMTILPPEGGATGGGPEIATFDVPIAAGFTTVVTAYADQVGRLLFILDTPDGEQTIRPVFEGTLVVEHDIDSGPVVDVVLWVLTYEERSVTLGRLVPGATIEETVEAGPHTLLLLDERGEEIVRTDVFIVDDETTVVRVSEMLDAPGRPPSARSTPPPSSEIPVPGRIDTGAGGADRRVSTPLVALVVAAFAVTLTAALVRRRRGAPASGIDHP